MKKKQYFKLMHINLTQDLSDYLDWKSNKTNRNISEVVREIIRDDLIQNKNAWFHSITNEYDALNGTKNIMR